MRRIALVGAMCATVLQPVAAMAGTKDFALQGYALPADKPVTIVLMRPDVSVGELAAGGVAQPNADWTKSAREQVEKALTAEMAERQLNFSSMEERIADFNQKKAALAQRCAPVSADATVTAPTVPAECAASAPAAADPELAVSEYNALHGAVVQAVLAHKYGMGAGKLPTKKENFSYTLGSGAGTLGQLSGANYGLFVMTNDQFASDGRKAMQVMGALGCIIGACMIVRGGVHVAYVSLVELESGNIVWFNVLRGSDGDVREAEGARAMVRSIMAGMPTRPGELRTASVAKSR